MAESPSTNGGNGRDRSGRFTVGNHGGPGNPHAQRVARLRVALIGAMTAEDIATVARVLVEHARAGDLAAIKLLLDYTIGKLSKADEDAAGGPVVVRVVTDEHWGRRGVG